MKYPSRITFDVNLSDNFLSVSYNDIKSKDKLSIWALAYLLNQGFYEKGVKTIRIPANDVTTALRLDFLSKTELFKDISWEIEYADNVKEKAEEIVKDITHERYLTYTDELSERGTKDKHSESMLEDNICSDLSKLCSGDFDKTTKSIRQFPANIFDGSICEKKRITKKFWIDVLAINNQKQLSVIELKAGKNSPLDLFVQAMDYAIYCHLFKSHINKYYFNDMPEVNNNKIAVYLVAENFHPALVGRGDITGIQSLIQSNELFDFIFIEIKTDNDAISTYEIIFDTRTNESNNS